jgi:hypothetical protein
MHVSLSEYWEKVHRPPDCHRPIWQRQWSHMRSPALLAGGTRTPGQGRIPRRLAAVRAVGRTHRERQRLHQRAGSCSSARQKSAFMSIVVFDTNVPKMILCWPLKLTSDPDAPPNPITRSRISDRLLRADLEPARLGNRLCRPGRLGSGGSDSQIGIRSRAEEKIHRG